MINAVEPLTDDQFDALLSGHGDADTMEILNAVQDSINRHYLMQVGPFLAERSDVGEVAWAHMQIIHSEHPDMLRNILRYPYFRPWAIRTLADPDKADPNVLVGYVASVYGHIGKRAPIPVTDDTEHMFSPGGGVYPTVAKPSAKEPIIATEIIGEHTRPTIFEDLCPERDIFRRHPADHARAPLGRTSDLSTWQFMSDGGFDFIFNHMPQYVPTVSHTLRCVTPLRGNRGRNISATHADALGAVAMALPGSGERFANLLLKELQTGKMHALHRMYELYDPSNEAIIHTGWTPTPQTVNEALCSTYAHLSIVEWWHARLENTDSAWTHYRHHSANAPFAGCNTPSPPTWRKPHD